MEVAVKSLFSGLTCQIRSHNRNVDFPTRIPRAGLQPQVTSYNWKISTRASLKPLPRALAVSQGLEDVDISPSSRSKDSESTSEAGEIKMRIHVSSEKTQTIYDKVFSRLVEAAQPIPGFRRVKGGKTPNIPKEVLLKILGPSKVNKEAIKKIINTSMAECVANEGLEVSKDLKIEESYEELEVAFQPGQEFSFNAIVQLTKTDSKKR